MPIARWLTRLFSSPPPQIPEPLWEESIARMRFLERLAPGDLRRLRSLAEEFLHRKAVGGAGGFEVSDGIAVAIAVQACLPVLNLTLDLYDDMPGVIVYPSEFMVPRSEIDDAGVVHEWVEPLAGEALDAGGAVVLSWEDVDRGEEFGGDYNVVIHEFVHKIDMHHGAANGCPPFLADYHRGMDPAEWKRAFSAAFEDFSRRVERIDRRLEGTRRASRHDLLADQLYGNLPLDPYAASNPAEFFAVASEAFFLWPVPLHEDYPDVYRLLARYYRQETLGAEPA